MSINAEPWSGSGHVVRDEVVRGLAYASLAHYADAAGHFAIAREHAAGGHSALLAALDAFIESHTRYWHAQTELHEATHHFVLASNDQEARLADLQDALHSPEAIASSGAESAPLTRTPALPATPDPLPTNNSSVLEIQCFDRFRVVRNGAEVPLCRSRNGQAILRYLAAQPRHRATQDVLIETFWPEEEPEVARHKLHVATSALRRSLDGAASSRGQSHITFANGVYELNPRLQIDVDVDRFEAAFQAGRSSTMPSAAGHYLEACRLYIGAFLADEVYVDWTAIRREQLAQAYLEMCRALSQHFLAIEEYAQAIHWATRIVSEDRCNEEAYRVLMRACAADGRRTDALRFYQRCETALRDELGIEPTRETSEVFYAVLGGTNRRE